MWNRSDTDAGCKPVGVHFCIDSHASHESKRSMYSSSSRMSTEAPRCRLAQSSISSNASGSESVRGSWGKHVIFACLNSGCSPGSRVSPSLARHHQVLLCAAAMAVDR